MSFLRIARPRIASSLCAFNRTYASEAGNSVVLPRLMADLKDAMRAKDTPRLNVLRTIRAEITNASKTPKPIDSDSKLLALLKKQMANAEKAIAEFESAKREDLIEKERAQMKVMQAYVEEIPVMSQADMDALVEEAVALLTKDSGKAPFGAVMKAVLAKATGLPVDQSYLTEKIKKATS